jgi:multidrug efflux pump
VDVAGQDLRIFVQIGFVVLVGLASKNAIFIVEFAKPQREEGKPLRAATREACRLRPILVLQWLGRRREQAAPLAEPTGNPH